STKRGKARSYVYTRNRWLLALAFYLRSDERHRWAPIRVTQFTQRADLKLVGSGRREATDSHLFGAGQRHRGPGTKDSARAFECVMHVVGNGAGLTFDLHNGLSAVRAAVDPTELRRCQRLRRRPCGGRCRKAAGVERRQIVVARAFDVMPKQL